MIFSTTVAVVVAVGAAFVVSLVRPTGSARYDPEHLHDVMFEDDSDSVLVASHNGVWRLAPGEAAAIGPATLHVRALAASSGVIFAAGSPQPGTDLTGVMQSDDSGRTWSTTGTGGGLDIRALVIDGVNVIAADGSPSRIVASSARVVWRQRSIGPSVSRMVTDPQEISQLLAIADGMFQRGYEGGTGWRIDPVATSPAPELLDLEWPSASLLYALSGDDDVFASADSGQSWSLAGSAPRNAVALDVRNSDGWLAIATSDGRVAISQDGRSWTDLMPPT